MIIGIDAGALAEKEKTGIARQTKAILNWLKENDLRHRYFIYDRPKRGWRYFWLPLLVYLNKVDVFLGLNQALPIFLTCPSVVVVHDLAFEYYPETFPDKGRRLRRLTRQAVKKATHIIARSVSTKKDLIKLYRVPGENITVVY